MTKRKCNKHRYPTEKAAWKSVKWLKKNKPNMAASKPYECPYCDGYHLTTDIGRYRRKIYKPTGRLPQP